MNVYDFDQTIFFPDSSYCFVLYCLRNYPRAVLPSLPMAAVEGLRCLLNLSQTRELKQELFSFLERLDDVDRVVAEFWEEHRSGVSAWYLQQQRPDDLVISASPEFLLRPIAEELGFRLIATRMEKSTGRIIGNNCHDAEKVCRFLKEFPQEKVEEFYSDSLSDSPMAWFAETAWLVKNENERIPWQIRPNK